MTYKIYFIEKTRAQLCASVHTTTCGVMMVMIVDAGKAAGYEVRLEREE